MTLLAFAAAPFGVAGANPLLAVGFLNPLLAGGFGLVILPILIHLLSRRRFRRLDWAATHFLLEAERENRRRVRFEQWLLLALRCVAMALLAAVLARPFVRPGLIASLIGSHGQALRIVVLDDSASLGYRIGGGSEYDTVRAAAVRLVQWLSQEAAGDPVAIWLVTRPDEPLVSEVRLDSGRMREITASIDQTTISNLRANPAVLISNLAQRLSAMTELPAAEIYIISDFQRTDWIGTGESGRSCFEPLARLSAQGGAEPATARLPTIRVTLISSAGAGPDNTGLLDIALDRPQIIAGLPALMHVVVADYSIGGSWVGSGRERQLQVEVDGAAQPPVVLDDLSPGEPKTITMEVAIADPGFREITVRLSPGDAFPADDVRRLTVRAKDSVSVLIVNGQPAIESYADEAYLLRNALSPPGAFSSGLRVDVIDVSELEGTELARFDCVLLCNVARPSDGALSALSRFVRDGGGLGIFLGSEIVDLREFNRAFHGGGLLPVELQEVVLAGERGVGMVRVGDHPVTSAFSANAESVSEYVRFRSYVRTSELAAQTEDERPGTDAGTAEIPGARILARYLDAEQSPALIENSFGNGRVMLFTSTVDLEWNDWGRAPDGSYVVTMLEMANYLARRDAHPRQFIVGAPLAVLLDSSGAPPTATLKSPAYPEDPSEELAAVLQGDLVEYRSRPSTRLGIYRFECALRGGLPESRPLAVNLDANESDLTRATAEEISAALAGIPHAQIGASDQFLGGGAETRRELWPAALLLLALVLVSEQALAWWFGRIEHAGFGLRRVSGRGAEVAA